METALSPEGIMEHALKSRASYMTLIWEFDIWNKYGEM